VGIGIRDMLMNTIGSQAEWLSRELVGDVDARVPCGLFTAAAGRWHVA